MGEVGLGKSSFEIVKDATVDDEGKRRKELYVLHKTKQMLTK